MARYVMLRVQGNGRKRSFASLHRFDVVDVVEAENLEEDQKAAMIICSYGHSATATPSS